MWLFFSSTAVIWKSVVHMQKRDVFFIEGRWGGCVTRWNAFQIFFDSLVSIYVGFTETVSLKMWGGLNIYLITYEFMVMAQEKPSDSIKKIKIAYMIISLIASSNLDNLSDGHFWTSTELSKIIWNKSNWLISWGNKFKLLNKNTISDF